MKTLPNFFIVGAARSGTSSLDQYLSQHPEIFIASKKETHFFARDSLPARFMGSGDERLNQGLIRDEEQYAQLFARVMAQKAIGESSAFYLCLPGTAERIAQALPEAKILMILREPVDRTYSAYMFLKRDGRETLSFEEGLRQEAARKEQGYEPMWWYTELSQYAAQVQRYLEVFGREQVKVLLYEEFYANPGRLLREVFAFLGVREDVTIDTSVRYNVSGTPRSRWLYTPLNHFIYNPSPLEKRIKSLIPLHLRKKWASKATGVLTRPVPLEPPIHAKLKDYLAEDVSKLEELLHRDLRSWHRRETGIAQKS